MLKKRNLLILSVLAGTLSLASAQKPKVPSSLEKEHEEIHAQLVAATQVGGKTGAAAKALAKVLHPHFVREQEVALPPLGVLQKLAAGKTDPTFKEAARLSAILEKELPRMLQEHQKIALAAKHLEAVALKERRHAQVELARNLNFHAKTEEQVTYPAAILVSRLVK